MKKIKYLLILILLSGGLFLYSKSALAAYCWCRDPDGFCSAPVTVDQDGNPFTAQSQCDDYCFSQGEGAIHYDQSYIDYSKTSECVTQSYCWCKLPNGTCENHTEDDQGYLFGSQAECNSYCSGRGFTAIHYETTYHDYSQTAECGKTGTTGGTGGTGSTGGSGGTTAGSESGSNYTPGDMSRFNDAKEKIKTLNQLPTIKPQELIGRLIKALTMFMGAIMFVLVIYAGLLWMTAQGNGDKIEKAKKIIVWAALGVAAMLLSNVVAQFVFNSLNV